MRPFVVPLALLALTALLSQPVRPAVAAEEQIDQKTDEKTDERRAFVADAVRAIDGLATAWRVTDVIWDVDARYGTFADLDGDGDDDYVATEMLHGPERVTTYLRGEDGWERAARFGEELQNRHPVEVWVTSDGGNGHAGIVVCTGWAPYFLVYRTDGVGNAVGAPLHASRILPPRVSTAGGVDNNPYRLTEVIAATESSPAKLVGTLIDESDDGERIVEKSWRIALLDDRMKLRRVAGMRQPPRRLDEKTIPDGVTAPRGDGACEHLDERRTGAFEFHLNDLDRDGVDDLVAFTPDFAAHVFPGEETGGRLAFAPELVPARPISLDSATAWLGRLADPTGDAALDAMQLAFVQGFAFAEGGTDETRVLVTSMWGQPWVASYFWTGRALVPVFRDRRVWPAGERRWERHTWEEVWSDVTGDGAPDSLAVSVGNEFVVEDGARRDLHDGGRLAALIWWRGESDRDASEVVTLFPDAVEVPEDPNAAMPVSIAPVRVEGRPDAERYCIYYRPWKVAIFVERDASRLPDGGERSARRARLWLQRGHELLDAPPEIDACDEGKCHRGLRLEPHRVRDALHCFARSVAEKPTAAAHHGVARCHSRLEEVPAAFAAYRAYLEAGGEAESPDTSHDDLLALFIDEDFLRFLRDR